VFEFNYRGKIHYLENTFGLLTTNWSITYGDWIAINKQRFVNGYQSGNHTTIYGGEANRKKTTGYRLERD